MCLCEEQRALSFSSEAKNLTRRHGNLKRPSVRYEIATLTLAMTAIGCFVGSENALRLVALRYSPSVAYGASSLDRGRLPYISS